MGSDGVINIENKFGDISFEGWDQKEVQINVFISVKGRKEDKVEDLLNRIVPSMDKRGKFLDIKSEILNRKKSFFRDLFYSVSDIEFNRSNLDIHYSIKMPKDVEIRVTNKFGDVSFTDFTGRPTVELQHGDLRFTDAVTNADITLKFGKLESTESFEGSVELSNGELKLRNSNYLDLESTGSEIYVETIDQLNINSSKDEIHLVQSGKIDGSLKYSDLKIDRGGQELDMNLHFGSLQIDDFTENNPNIQIEQRNSDVILEVKNISFDLDATMEGGSMRLPKSVTNLESNLLNAKDKLREVQATYGTAGMGSIKIVGKKGEIFFKED